jgi:hypothetical protein
MGKTEQLKEQILSQNPTDQQRDAIFAEELEFLLRASPGSGKTWTSCRRFIWRGANWGSKVGGLALLSFTNTAIREFYEATIKVGRRDLLSEPNFIGTLDSFIERFLITPFGHLPVGLSKRPKLFTDAHAARLKGGGFSTFIEFGNGTKMPVETGKLTPIIKDGGIAYGFPGMNGQLAVVKVISKEAPPVALLKTGYYSHEHRKFWAYYLLKKRPDICRILARKFPEIIVDEAQDTNEWLLECLKELRKAGAKVTLVGDPDQCIYEYSRAAPDSLAALKTAWGIRELPLSKSFRCNDHIAAAVRMVSGNTTFTGSGVPRTDLEGAFIVRDPGENFGHSISSFEKLLGDVGIKKDEASILCRGHSQIQSIRGSANYNSFKGQTKEFAHAAFLRDCRKDFRGAFRQFEKSLRGISADDPLWDKIEADEDCADAMAIRLALWRFVKSEDGLPSVSLSGDDWIAMLKERLEKLIPLIGISGPIKLGQKIKKSGTAEQLRLPIFAPETLFPPIRQETIHQVKGESINAVLFLGSSKFFNSVVSSIDSNENTEDRRLAYVAMTRARHVLLIGLPATHYDAHAAKWIQWGFKTI